MILSDVTIREELAAGRIVIDPLRDGSVQPSSVDLHCDRYFRVFRNDTTPFIDPKQPQEDLTELVEVPDGRAFILHPGEFVLGSTLERVALPDDLVARLEGKSSLGRLGLLIHSSLPGSEPVMVLLPDGRLEPRPIADVVAKNLDAKVVGFDPETFEVGYHDVTGWYEGPADRIFEVRLGSGRRVRVTGGHNLFTLDRDGALQKVRTGQLQPGTMVAIPRTIPDPVDHRPDELDLLELVPDADLHELVCEGAAVRRAFDSRSGAVVRALRVGGYKHTDYYRRRSRLPLPVALQVGGLVTELGPGDRVGIRGARHSVACRITVDADFAWLLGLYVAEGSRRRNQVVFSNTDELILDRVERTLRRLGLPIYRTSAAITCCSTILSMVLGWLQMGERAREKRVPPLVFGWDRPLIEAFVDGLVDGDGSRESSRTSVWTTSDALVGDLFLLFARLGQRAGTSSTLRRLRDVYRSAGDSEVTELDRLVDGGLAWDRVVEVVDTGSVEPIFDLEVRPDGRKIQNFLAGHGGVFVSNTAGFVDAGWDGHLTLELSNVANLPIAIYPGMKIGQISFLRMTTSAANPYGSQIAGSKYQGQRGPTPSRYYLNFRDEPPEST
jgi:dCTP deaminase